MTEIILEHPAPHLCSRPAAARWKKAFLTVFSLLSSILLEKWQVKWRCKLPHIREKKKKSINTWNWFKRLPLNRSRRCRPTYQHAVSKLGKGVRVLTFSRFSISYALRRTQRDASAKHCHVLPTRLLQQTGQFTGYFQMWRTYKQDGGIWR